jgi:quaternary ammonium compound-resistance protein SugE
MQWFILLIAGLFEVVWATGLKYSDGFTKLVPSAITIIGLIVSMYLLALSLKSLPLGTAYAVWTGIGTVGTAILGIVFFKEPIDLARLIFIGFIVVGIIGLKLVSSH